MNKLYFVIGFIFLNVTVKAQNGLTSDHFVKPEIYPKIMTSDLLFKGNPKEVYKEDYIYEDDVEKYKGFAQWKFNTKKQLVEFNWIITGNKSIDKTIYNYNEDLLVSIVKLDVNNSANFIKKEYFYNSNNAIEKMVEAYSNGDTIQIIKYKYKDSKSRNPFKCERFDWRKSKKGIREMYLRETSIVEYDNDMPVKITSYNDDNQFNTAIFYKYKSKFLTEERLAIDEKFIVGTTFAYKRDDQNRILEKIYYTNGKRSSYTRNYFGKDFLIKTINGDPDEVTSIEEFSYNEYGNMIAECYEKCETGEIKDTTYVIKYDDKGNIVESREFRNEKPVTRYAYKYKY